jgi:hypothetical protein
MMSQFRTRIFQSSIVVESLECCLGRSPLVNLRWELRKWLKAQLDTNSHVGIDVVSESM